MQRRDELEARSGVNAPKAVREKTEPPRGLRGAPTSYIWSDVSKIDTATGVKNSNLNKMNHPGYELENKENKGRINPYVKSPNIPPGRGETG